MINIGINQKPKTNILERRCTSKKLVSHDERYNIKALANKTLRDSDNLIYRSVGRGLCIGFLLSVIQQTSKATEEQIRSRRKKRENRLSTLDHSVDFM